jgi:hypothetical protein
MVTQRGDPGGEVVVSGAVRETAGPAVSESDKIFSYRADRKREAFRVACIERVHSSNVFRIGSIIHRGNLAHARLSPFLAGILSVSVDSTFYVLCEWKTYGTLY